MSLVGGSSHFFFSAACWLAHKYKPRQAPIIVFSYLLFWCIKTNLSFRDAVPPILYREDKTRDETSTLEISILTHIVNHTSFMTTVCLYLPMVVVSYYLQLIVQVELYHDPYASEIVAFSEHEKETWVWNKTSDMTTIVLILVVQHYLTQKNMIIQTIKQMMISRQ